MIPAHDLKSDREAVGGEAAGDAGSGLAGEIEGEGEGKAVEDGRGGRPVDLGGPFVDPPGGEGHLRREQEVVLLEKLAGLMIEGCTGYFGATVFFAGVATALPDHFGEARFEGLWIFVVGLADAGGHGNKPADLGAGAGVIPAWIDCFDVAAKVGEALGGLACQAAHVGVNCGVSEVGAPGDAQALQGGQRVGDGGNVVVGLVGNCSGVAWVGTGYGLGEEGGVGDGAGDGTVVGAGRPDVEIGPVGKPPERGFEAENAAQGGGDTD